MSIVTFSNTEMVAKSEILTKSGYASNFDRMVYYNRSAKKAFSAEFVEDHPINELQERISEATNDGEWRFYTNSPLPPAVKRELESVLG
jgi:hypothetical protein